MPPPAPDLIEDLVEDILLRLPPEDPGCLFRASLVCNRWRALLTGRAFGRRYREFHRSPPLLGFFENQFFACCFAAPSSPASPVPPIHPGHRRLDALDSRHGLVLLDVKDQRGAPVDRLAVWDPICRRQWEFPFPELAWPLGYRDLVCSAAVLCAADGCDHLDCRGRGGPFLVACLCSDEEGGFYASLYSSAARAWSPVTSFEHSMAANLNSVSNVLVGNALYFTCNCEPTMMILRYDLASRQLSIIDGPAGIQADHNKYVLVRTDDGVLGFANLQGSTLCVWSSIEPCANGRRPVVAWGQQRVVELEKLLPPHAFSAQLYVTGFAEGVGVIVLTIAGNFTIELKSSRVKNVPERILHATPYCSFYTPDQAGGTIVHLPMASSENSQASRDPLLQQPSMDVSEEMEREEEGKWKKDDNDEQSGQGLEQASDMFELCCRAIVDGDLAIARIFAVRTLQCRFLLHGKLSPNCVYAYYLYGCTLLYKLHPDSEPSSESDDVEDLNLALKMLHIARKILEKCPGNSMKNVKIFSALADVIILSTHGRGSMRREDRDYALRVCFKALAISEHLIEPDNYWIIKLNVSICLIFELASNIGDAVAYCAKAISLCKSRVSNLKNAKEALLLDKGDNASAAEAGVERSALKYEIEFFTGMSCKLKKKLEYLEQAPTTKASGEENVGDAMPRAASFTPASNLQELLSIFDPILRKTRCAPIWPEPQGV